MTMKRQLFLPYATSQRRLLCTMMKLIVLIVLSSCVNVNAWTQSTIRRRANKSAQFMTTTTTMSSAKESFLASLDHLDRLNEHNKERTRLLQEVIDTKLEDNDKNGMSIQNDGLLSESMQAVAEGTWKVVYAPHMTTMAGLAGGGSFDVFYLLENDGTMVSHAVCDFSWLLPTGKVILSVSGTWGSVSSNICRVDFDKAWVTLNQDEPYGTFEDVPENGSKSIISALGRLFFIEQVSVFPVSFLDENLIVFDFELLGTRICARKID